MPTAVIAGFARTPFQFAFKGGFKDVRADDLAGAAIKGLVERTRVSPWDIEDVLLGCAFPEGAQGYNIARIAALLGGLPMTVPGTTISRFCGSSMSAVHYAASHIMAGMGDVFIAGGVESMTGIAGGGKPAAPNPRFLPGGDLADVEAYVAMGQTAENVASRYGIARASQDRFAESSQMRAAAAASAGHTRSEIVPIAAPSGLLETDGTIRPDTNVEKLGALAPAFDPHGTVTAGSSSPLTDGAAVLLVCSEDYAKRNRLSVMAAIRSFAVSGCDPKLMGIGPVEASRKAIGRAGISIDALDIVELNEAFASQSLACIAELGLAPDKVNVEGGAVALGHPLGATGARLIGKAADLLQRTGGRYGLATQCVGGGQGVATIVERPDRW